MKLNFEKQLFPLIQRCQAAFFSATEQSANATPPEPHKARQQKLLVLRRNPDVVQAKERGAPEQADGHTLLYVQETSIAENPLL